MIGVNPRFKEIVYTEEFRSMDIPHTRFDFTRRKHFLNHLKKATTSSIICYTEDKICIK